MTSGGASMSGAQAPVITVADGLSRAQRETAERSVAAMAARAQKAAMQALGTGDKQQKAALAGHRPLLDLMPADPAAAPVLAGLPDYDTEGEPAERVLGRPPPYDFAWNWNTGAGPYRLTTNNNTGRILLYGRLNGGDRFSHIHAGFGIFLSTTRPVTPNGGAVRRAAISWDTQAGGVGAYAICEGGMEFTVLEDGNPLWVTTSKLWRRRVSGGIDAEEDGFRGPMTNYWDPRSLNFAMQPGRGYTFNVGFWITCDRGFGPYGAALTQGLMDGFVDSMGITGL